MSWVALAAVLWMGPPALAGGDGPEVSQSRGKKDGVVVLWPRVVPEGPDAELDAVALAVQEHLVQLAGAVVDPSLVNVRPAPERVCPQAGCRGLSLGAVIGHHEGGCFAVALVGLPAGGDVQLVPWAGEVLASRRHVPHRTPPEDKLAVKEFVPCDQLVGALADPKVQRALETALGVGAASHESNSE